MAAKKFHLNSKTRQVGVCTASVCPFGESTPHFGTQDEALTFMQHAEAKSNKVFNKISRSADKSNNIPSYINLDDCPQLADVLDAELMDRMIAENFVRASAHPLDPNLNVLVYSPQVQHLGKWNEATKSARGLIVYIPNKSTKDALIVERPWEKFYTLEQHDSGWTLGDEEDGASNSAADLMSQIDFDAPATVTDKLDGSLGVLHIDPRGEIAVSTKGSFASEQAIDYTKFIRSNQNYLDAATQLKKQHPDKTFMFELVGAKNQIVLEYDRDDVILLGAVNKKTGQHYDAKEFSNIWSPENDLSQTEVMEAKNLREALSIPARKNREGVVVQIKSSDPKKQLQIKIKQDDYLKLHRLMASYSPNAVRDTINQSNATLSEIIDAARSKDVSKIQGIENTLAPIREGRGNFHANLLERNISSLNEGVLPIAEKVDSAHKYIESLPVHDFSQSAEARKNFALSIQNRDPHEKSILFSMYAAKSQGKSMDEISTKNILSLMSKQIRGEKSE